MKKRLLSSIIAVSLWLACPGLNAKPVSTPVDDSVKGEEQVGLTKPDQGEEVPVVGDLETMPQWQLARENAINENELIEAFMYCFSGTVRWKSALGVGPTEHMIPATPYTIDNTFETTDSAKEGPPVVGDLGGPVEEIL